MQFYLEGVIPALLTPFTEGGKSVDYDKARALASRLADQGVYGIFPCGTTGEGMLMTVDERKRLIEELVPEVGKRIKVVAHTGAFDTATTIELTRHAMESGAAAAGVVTPGFYTLDRACLKAHYKAVAEAVPGFPVLLYNIPGCAKNVLAPDLTCELAHECDNVVGMKDSGGSIQALSAVLAGAPKGFNVINGVDEYTYQALLTGANGSVSSTANVVPELFLDIFHNVRNSKLQAALAAQVKLSMACGLFRYGAMVAYYKEGLRLRGFDAGFVRSPQRELTQEEKTAFAKDIEKAQIF
ncbi:MAG: dihydrodipicolinate synthase family protein [FCB group bacterium]|jgi:dihydrodipicolinate synthase/N-acetylneuraminate lyase|nr:dihydrodipicolinate synthase family protein [FCB group bacterium]